MSGALWYRDMTRVIPLTYGPAYCRDMLAADALHQVAMVLTPPEADYLSLIEGIRSAIAPQSIDVARHLEVFMRRIQDLSPDELVELYDETFSGDLRPAREIASILATSPLSKEEIVAVSNVLTALLGRLETNRNPFAVPVRALCLALTEESDSNRVDQQSAFRNQQ
jgi:nitrate reductase assembly molybdenum cofactor insertion protein NarJ